MINSKTRPELNIFKTVFAYKGNKYNKIIEGMSEKDSSESQVKRIRQEELKEIILEHQNKYEKGYYTYEDWCKLH